MSLKGGQPEKLDEHDVAILENQPLYFNNLHYQGGAKARIAVDICQFLLKNKWGVSESNDLDPLNPRVRLFCMNVTNHRSQKSTTLLLSDVE